MARWISTLMNALCRPLVRRITAELTPYQERVLRDTAAVRRTTDLVALPLVVKTEIEHTQQLPLSFLREQGDLAFVGFRSDTLKDHFRTARCLIPPVDDDRSLVSDCLVFLDEYHFIRTIRELPTLFSPVRRTLMLPFCGHYLPENHVRKILHQLGFPEIFILDYIRTHDGFSISGISHAAIVSSEPIMVSPTADTFSGTRWLIASRFPTAS